MYCSQSWSPWQNDKELIEKIQQRYIKNISGMRNLQHSERLREFNMLTLSDGKNYVDMIFTYKCINGHINFPATELGLLVKASISRSNGHQLTQSCPNNNICANLSSCRAASRWNYKLPLDTVSSRTLSCFKQMLLKHYCRSQF